MTPEQIQLLSDLGTTVILLTFMIQLQIRLNNKVNQIENELEALTSHKTILDKIAELKEELDCLNRELH